MSAAAKTGKVGESLSSHAPAVESMVEICMLERLSRALGPDESCEAKRGKGDKYAKSLKLLGAYGEQMKKLAKAEGPEGKALADATVEGIGEDGLDDYKDVISAAADGLVDLVASGWVRAELRKNVTKYETTVLSIALDILAEARQSLAAANDADEEACTTLKSYEAEAKALDEAALRFGWPFGTSVLRFMIHERRRDVEKLEADVLSFMMAYAYLAHWAEKSKSKAPPKGDEAAAGEIEAATKCAAIAERSKDQCKKHLDFLDARLSFNHLDTIASLDNDPGSQGLVTRPLGIPECRDVLAIRQAIGRKDQ